MPAQWFKQKNRNLTGALPPSEFSVCDVLSTANI